MKAEVRLINSYNAYFDYYLINSIYLFILAVIQDASNNINEIILCCIILIHAEVVLGVYSKQNNTKI